jgi:enterochelin esterase-like enzyme
MRKFIFLFLISTLLLPAMLFSQSGGKVFDNLSMPSKLLKMDRKYAIYLPPDYETSQRSYPVLYLLHGSGDDQSGWIQFGEVKNIADKAIQEGKCTAMIIVMPDGNTGQRGYFNSPKGDWNSMGGGGTFMYALHHPELFSSACPLSASVGPISMEEASTRWEKQYPGISKEDLNTYFKRHSALELVNAMPDDQKKAVRWYIDCGDDDFLYEGNCLVHIAMRKKEIPHEFRTRDGGHTWTYWREALPTVLEFVSQSFHQF